MGGIHPTHIFLPQGETPQKMVLGWIMLLPAQEREKTIKEHEVIPGRKAIITHYSLPFPFPYNKKKNHTIKPRVRQFCVDIAHSFIWRNIDAELLREHSVRRYCAYYKVCKFCVISSFASTLASKLRKKIKKIACAKKEKKSHAQKKIRAWIRTRDF